MLTFKDQVTMTIADTSSVHGNGWAAKSHQPAVHRQTVTTLKAKMQPNFMEVYPYPVHPALAQLFSA